MTKSTQAVLFLCLVLCWHFHWGEMKKDLFNLGKARNRIMRIKSSSLQKDLAALRNLTDDCRLEVLYARSVRNFSLTAEDIEILHGCPLKILDLRKSSCFPSSSHIDLTGLTQLDKLSLSHCQTTNFVITGLPDSLRRLDIYGLTKKNFELADTNYTFLESLEKISVGRASQCCPGAIFPHPLPRDVCYISSYKAKLVCGLSDDGAVLGIMRDEDVSVLRNQLTSTCNVSSLYVELPEFTITDEDVSILNQCPLKELRLFDSQCFSSSTVELSGLTQLTWLSIPICRNSDFVITRLPASLEWLEMTGLAEFNVRLEEDVGIPEFGKNLKEINAYNPAMCCANIQNRMFSQDLSRVCRAFLVSDCGLTTDLIGNVYLSVDSREQLDNVTYRHDKCDDTREDACQKSVLENVTRFYAAGADVFLTQDDIDVLSESLVEYMFLPYTSCFSGSIDLSSLSNLKALSIPYCTKLDFTITGVPATLEHLDIRGSNADNIELGALDTQSGVSLRQVEVSKPVACQCPQVWFGTSLAENTKCGLTNTIYTAVDFFSEDSGFYYKFHFDYAAGFQPEGFGSAISSCEYLIENSVLRILLWTMASFAMLGNSAVLIYRLGWDRKSLKKSHGVYPFHLAVSDLLMGIYLFIIVDRDTQFRGKYGLFDQEWRWGPLCHLAGFLSTLSSETSAMFILLITIDRFLAIQFPFRQYRISLQYAWMLCVAVWLTGLTAATLPLVVSGWDEVYSYSSICVALPLNRIAYTGSGYATGIFIGANSALFVMIAVGQASIYKAYWANSKQATLHEDQAKRRYKQDVTIARKLSLIVITDFLCWFPICIMGLMAQTGQVIPNSAYAWSAVGVLPINSALNPLLYTLRNVSTDGVTSCLTKCYRRSICMCSYNLTPQAGDSTINFVGSQSVQQETDSSRVNGTTEQSF